MKFSCCTKVIAEAFQMIAGVVPQRSLKPILTRARVTAEKDSIIVEGTDLEVSARYTFPCGTIDTCGSVAIPADKVASILRDISDEEVHLEATDGVVTINCEQGYYRVLGEDPENFPPIPLFESGGIKLAGDVLGDMLKKTVLAAAEEKSRYSLNGVLIHIHEKKITMVATDGRRLAVREEKLKVKAEDRSGIVPLKGVSAIRRVVEGAEGAELAIGENMVMARAGGAEAYSRLIEGKFPDYSKVVPSGNDNHVSVNREDLLSFVRRVALLSSGESRAVKLSIGKNTIKLSARTAEVGESELSLAAAYDGDAIEIDFNPDYLLDVLKVLDAEEVVLELKDGQCAGMIRDGKEFTYVIMPLSV